MSAGIGASKSHVGPARRVGRVIGLDGLRGLAILLVILRHYDAELFTGGGMVGVDLFFVLSGFLITSLLVAEWGRFQSISIRAFYARRALRLIPALYVMLAGYLVLIAVMSDDLGTSFEVALQTVGFVSTYIFNFVSATNINVGNELGPLWTLSVEEQFYLVWPLVLIVLLRRRTKPVTIAALVVLMIAVTWVLRAYTWQIGGVAIYTLTTTWIDGLLIGAALALVRHYNLLPGGAMRRALQSRLLQVMAWLMVLGAVFLPEAKSSGTTYIWVLPVLAVAMGCIVWSVVEHDQTDSGDLWGKVLGLLRSRPLVWLGRLSYSLYLYNFVVRVVLATQFPEQTLVVTVVGLVLTFALACASYYLVEMPALRVKKRFEAGVSVVDVENEEPSTGPRRQPADEPADETTPLPWRPETAVPNHLRPEVISR